jgi:hypothetical protein
VTAQGAMRKGLTSFAWGILRAARHPLRLATDLQKYSRTTIKFSAFCSKYTQRSILTVGAISARISALPMWSLGPILRHWRPQHDIPIG